MVLGASPPEPVSILMITKLDLTDGFAQPFNLEPVVDYMPELGSMAGIAVTVVCEPSNKQHRIEKPKNIS